MTTAVLEEEQQQMRIMDPVAGDLKINWDKNKPDEVATARAAFEKAKKRGLLMYKTTRFGAKTGTQLHEFDPKAEKIVGMPPMVGG